jgi:hypothetical protein
LRELVQVNEEPTSRLCRRTPVGCIAWLGALVGNE